MNRSLRRLCVRLCLAVLVLLALCAAFLAPVLRYTPTAHAGSPPFRLDPPLPGGAVLTHVTIHNLYMDRNWDSDNVSLPSAETLDDFTSKLVSSGYLAGLAQYGFANATFDGSDHATSECPGPSGPTFDYFDVSTWILCMKHKVATSSGTNLWLVYVPAGLGFDMLGFTSCSATTDGFAGFHAATLPSVIPPDTPQLFGVVFTQCTSLASSASDVLNATTSSAAHEIVETITDPTGQSWLDHDASNLYGLNVIQLYKDGEAADLCEPGGTAEQPTPDLPRIDAISAQQPGYAVAYYWSNLDGECVPAPRTITLNATGLPQFDAADVTVDSSHTITPFSEVVASGAFHSFAFISPVDDPSNLYQVRYVTDQPGFSGAVVADLTMTAAYTPQYYLTVQTQPFQVASYPSSLTPSGWEPAGGTVQLNADAIVDPGLAGERYQFIGWSGPVSGTGQSVSVTMNSPATVTAGYQLQDQVSVSTSGLGTTPTHIFNGSALLGTASDAAPVSLYLNDGLPLALSADPDISLADGTQLLFTGFNPAPPTTLSGPFSTVASYQTMSTVITTGLNNGSISGSGAAGLAQSYTAQWSAVQADFAAAQFGQALDDLTSFMSHLDAQSSKKLTTAFATQLDLLALAVYANALAQASTAGQIDAATANADEAFYQARVTALGGTPVSPGQDSANAASRR